MVPPFVRILLRYRPNRAFFRQSTHFPHVPHLQFVLLSGETPLEEWQAMAAMAYLGARTSQWQGWTFFTEVVLVHRERERAHPVRSNQV